MTNEEKKEYERNWYKTKGKEKRIAANKRWREKAKIVYKEFRKTLMCVRCGESHPACLDLHYLDPTTKFKSVAQLAGRASLSGLKKEVDKCIVLCANCHRKEHYAS